MFYEKLKEHRRQLGLSQDQLAKRLNVSGDTIEQWESGLSMPDLENVMKLSDLFQVSIDYLLRDRKSNSEFSYYTRLKEEKKTLSKNKIISLGVFALSVMCFLTLLVISFLEPILYVGNNDQTYRGFIAYYLAYQEFATVVIFAFITLISSVTYLILPEEKWINLFRKKK